MDQGEAKDFRHLRKVPEADGVKADVCGISGVKGPVGGERVEMNVPVQLIAVGLNQGEDCRSHFGTALSVCEGEGEGAMSGRDEMGEETSVMKKIGSQALGDRKRPEAVRDVGQGVFEEILRPEKDAFLMTGRTEQTRFAGEGDDFFLGTGRTRIDGHALAGIATREKAFDGVIDAVAEEAEVGLEAGGIRALEGGVMIIEDAIERGVMEDAGVVLDRNGRIRCEGLRRFHRDREMKNPCQPRSAEKTDANSSGYRAARSERVGCRRPGIG